MCYFVRDTLKPILFFPLKAEKNRLKIFAKIAEILKNKIQK